MRKDLHFEEALDLLTERYDALLPINKQAREISKEFGIPKQELVILAITESQVREWERTQTTIGNR